MRLTTEQRLRALEREVTILQDTIKLLHRLLKEQSNLINDYILQRVSKAEAVPSKEGGGHEDALYTFICNKKFNNLEKQIKYLYKAVEDLKFHLKAG